MTKLLVSVTNVQEAEWALESGVDIIDLKNPLSGALGALPLSTIEEIVSAVNGRRMVSATIGDLPMEPLLLAHAVKATAATGVDIVKVGFLPSNQSLECINAIRRNIEPDVKIVAVLPADMEFDLTIVNQFKKAGFYGAMLDTFYKNGRSLTDQLSIDAISQFLAEINRLKMESGVAGSLQIKDVEPLAMLQPDYMGFRGAVCVENSRVNRIMPDKIGHLKQMLHKYNVNKKISTVTEDYETLHCNAKALSV